MSYLFQPVTGYGGSPVTIPDMLKALSPTGPGVDDHAFMQYLDVCRNHGARIFQVEPTVWEINLTADRSYHPNVALMDDGD